MPQDYYARRDARIERLQQVAQKTAQEAEAAHNRAHKMASIIPFGQPILVGHHSEGRDRNYRGKITRTFAKSFELSKRAGELSDRASAAASNDAISSDAPDCVERLEDRIAYLEEAHARGIAYNKALRKRDLEAMKASGHPHEPHGQHMRGCGPDINGDIYLSFNNANSSQNIKRLKDRLVIEKRKRQALEALPEDSNGQTFTYGQITVIQNLVENRTQVKFPGKPREAVRNELSSRGFVWSRYNNAWQRKLSNGALYAAQGVAELYQDDWDKIRE